RNRPMRVIETSAAANTAAEMTRISTTTSSQTSTAVTAPGLLNSAPGAPTSPLARPRRDGRIRARAARRARRGGVAHRRDRRGCSGCGPPAVTLVPRSALPAAAAGRVLVPRLLVQLAEDAVGLHDVLHDLVPDHVAGTQVDELEPVDPFEDLLHHHQARARTG